MRLALLVIALLALIAAIALPVAFHTPARIVRPGMPEVRPFAPSEIRFDNGGLALAGQVFAGPAPRAALVIIHGSGESSRANGWYAQLVDGLAGEGYAVLLPDKRGSEQSSGDWRAASMEELATDTAAAVERMRALYPGLPVGVVGVSQGGWIAPIAASRDPGIGFVVSLSAAAVPPADQLVLEEVNTMTNDIGLPRWFARLIAPLTAWNIRANMHPAVWMHLNDFDATRYWAGVQQPSFIAYGALDAFDNVPVEASVARLADLGNPALGVHVYDNVGHGFFYYEDGRFSPAFLDDLAAFLADQAD